MRHTIFSARGFTLIELLVVITIIGLLSSVVLVGLQGFRAAGRDVRRIADLRSVQVGLELYFKKCRHYPGAEGCGNSLPIDASDNPGNPNQDRSWSLLSRALKSTGLNIPAVPNDPLYPTRTYYYASDRNVASQSLHYTIKAVLEDVDNAALDDDIDDNEEPGDISIQCGSASNDIYYCVGF